MDKIKTNLSAIAGEDSTNTKGAKITIPFNEKFNTEKSESSVTTEKISLPNSEKKIIDYLALELIPKNYVQIAMVLFNKELKAAVLREHRILKQNNRTKDLQVLSSMLKNLNQLEGFSSLVEFRKSIYQLRLNCTELTNASKNNKKKHEEYINTLQKKIEDFEKIEKPMYILAGLDENTISLIFATIQKQLAQAKKLELTGAETAEEIQQKEMEYNNNKQI